MYMYKRTYCSVYYIHVSSIPCDRQFLLGATFVIVVAGSAVTATSAGFIPHWSEVVGSNHHVLSLLTTTQATFTTSHIVNNGVRYITTFC